MTKEKILDNFYQGLKQISIFSYRLKTNLRNARRIQKTKSIKNFKNLVI